jgi:hypothetical protein
MHTEIGSSQMLEYGPDDASGLRSAILQDGFAICRGAVNAAEIAKIREFWLHRFQPRQATAPMIWGPHLGEENQVLYHETSDCCMFRSYDFLWNPAIDALTREVGLRLSRLRNDVADVDHRSGEYFEPDRYGIYITTSYYPPGRGWLHAHEDLADERRHWHFMLLLTFKGQDYRAGGLHIKNRDDVRVDVDAMVQPGDVVFFDGSLTHDVEQIQALPSRDLGRLQLFSIPTFMELPHESDRFLQSVSFGAYVKARLRRLKQRLISQVDYRYT